MPNFTRGLGQGKRKRRTGEAVESRDSDELCVRRAFLEAGDLFHTLRRETRKIAVGRGGALDLAGAVGDGLQRHRGDTYDTKGQEAFAFRAAL